METFTYTPSPEEIAQERGYWECQDRIADYDSWLEAEVAVLEDFSRWPLDDLLDEVDLVRSLTPDQDDVIAELETEIDRRRAA